MPADRLLVERGLCENRNLAQRLIMAGKVRTGPDTVVRKPGQALPVDSPLHVTESCPYVSRGAYKLLAALETHTPDLSHSVALDVGASTGGFTDVLLHAGVRKVYAVDVGYGQLHWRLRKDSRVICIERLNARHISRQYVPEPIEVMTVDVSFISLRTVLPPCAALLADNAWVFALVKPQFEAKRHEVARGGVVRDDTVRERCVQEIRTFAEETLGWSTLGVTPSPLTGPKGNQESVLAFRAPRPTGP